MKTIISTNIIFNFTEIATNFLSSFKDYENKALFDFISENFYKISNLRNFPISFKLKMKKDEISLNNAIAEKYKNSIHSLFSKLADFNSALFILSKSEYFSPYSSATFSSILMSYLYCLDHLHNKTVSIEHLEMVSETINYLCYYNKLAFEVYSGKECVIENKKFEDNKENLSELFQKINSTIESEKKIKPFLSFPFKVDHAQDENQCFILVEREDNKNLIFNNKEFSESKIFNSVVEMMDFCIQKNNDDIKHQKNKLVNLLNQKKLSQINFNELLEVFEILSKNIMARNSSIYLPNIAFKGKISDKYLSFNNEGMLIHFMANIKNENNQEDVIFIGEDENSYLYERFQYKKHLLIFIEKLLLNDTQQKIKNNNEKEFNLIKQNYQKTIKDIDDSAYDEHFEIYSFELFKND